MRDIDKITDICCEILEEMMSRPVWKLILDDQQDSATRRERMKKLVIRWQRDGIDLDDDKALTDAMMAAIIDKYSIKI